jgi:hypothetical protein
MLLGIISVHAHCSIDISSLNYTFILYLLYYCYYVIMLQDYAVLT